MPRYSVSALDVARLPVAESKTEHGEDRRLVEGGETFDAIAIALRHQHGVIGKPCNAISRCPAAEVVKCLRQIPVIEAEPRLDTGGENRVDQPVVECQARLVWHAASLRKHARPGNRKTIGLYAKPLHQRDIFRITMIVIAGDVAGIVVGDLRLSARKCPIR